MAFEEQSLFFFSTWTIYGICYHIASVLCFDFLALRHVGS